MNRLNLQTKEKTEFLDITADVQRIVADMNISSGICYLFVPHTTAGITLNEHADPDVIDDITRQLEKLAPSSGAYRHNEGNSPGHIKTGLTGSHVLVFIENGRLVLGTWQGIFFTEFDGPRSRTVLLKIVPG